MAWKAGCVLLLLACVSAGQEPTPASSADIRFDVHLVQIPVTVSSPDGRPVLGLKKDQFRLFEDGREQPVRHFSSEEVAVSAGVLVDASQSMDARMAMSREAVGRFLDLASPGDEFFAMEFSEQVQLLQDFTPDRNLVRREVNAIRPNGYTALLDAIYYGVQHSSRASNPRRALLILSDGGDNASVYKEEEIRKAVREADVRIFAISIRQRSRLLETLARESGGRAFRVDTPRELGETAMHVGAEMRSQYVLAYAPKNTGRGGKYRRVQVKLTPSSGAPPLTVSWRRGYFGPAGER